MTMTTTETKKLNASAAYENGQRVAQDLVQRIGNLLFDQPAPDDVTWTNVGTMAEVNSRLAAVVAFLEGTEK